jgi:hypothetical protein
MIAWALANWGKVIVGILVLSITIYIGVLQLNIKRLKFNNESLQTDLLVKTEEIGQWKKLYSILGDRIAEQNKSIKLLEAKTKEAQKRRVAADKKAAPIVRAAQESEKAVVSVPASTGTCESELQTIKDMLEAAK